MLDDVVGGAGERKLVGRLVGVRGLGRGLEALVLDVEAREHDVLQRAHPAQHDICHTARKEILGRDVD